MTTRQQVEHETVAMATLVAS